MEQVCALFVCLCGFAIIIFTFCAEKNAKFRLFKRCLHCRWSVGIGSLSSFLSLCFWGGGPGQSRGCPFPPGSAERCGGSRARGSAAGARSGHTPPVHTPPVRDFVSPENTPAPTLPSTSASHPPAEVSPPVGAGQSRAGQGQAALRVSLRAPGKLEVKRKEKGILVGVVGRSGSGAGWAERPRGRRRGACVTQGRKAEESCPRALELSKLLSSFLSLWLNLPLPSNAL